MLLSFTDGVTEAQNEAAEEYGEDRLIALLKANPRANATAMVNLVVSAVSEFTGFRFHDDVTVTAVAVC